MMSQNHLDVRKNQLYQYKLQNSTSTKTLNLKFDSNKQILETKQIRILTKQLSQEISLYQWRAKTEFPIVKILDFRVISDRFQAALIQIKLQSFPYSLSQLRQLPLIKVLYLLKESLIGFERLFDKFGSFLVNSKMVVINHNYKCKVWLNEEYPSNSYIPLQSDEGQFLLKVYKMFQKRSNHLKNTSLFFSEINKCTNFCQALNFIEIYAKQNKIGIPTTCRLQQKQIINEHKLVDSYDPSLTMSRAPKFLMNSNIRTSLNPHTMNDLIIKISKPFDQSNQKEEEAQIKMKMKGSGDTAPQIRSNPTISGSNKQIRDQSLLFQKRNREVGFKSEFLINMFDSKKNIKFGRKCNSNVESEQFSQKSLMKKEGSRTELERKDIRSADCFSNTVKSNEILDSQDEEQTKIKVTSVFQKNCWQKKLDGLFSSDEGSMKKSIQTGKQKRNTEKCLLKLQLLDSLGKNIHESFIHNQELFPEKEDYHPYTSQY